MSIGSSQSFRAWQIRRIQSMELFHQAVNQDSQQRPSSPSFSTLSLQQQQQQQKEESRQLQLLRQALKDHDFFFIPEDTGSSMMVPDMTRSLQKSFDMLELLQQEQLRKECRAMAYSPSRRGWWKKKSNQHANDHSAQIEMYPDSRFFWNEMAVFPLLQAYDHLASDVNSSNNNTMKSSNAAALNEMNCLEILLDHLIPVTSAFCGVQQNLSVSSTSDWCYDEILISRRSRFRAGTRFTKRGSDGRGHVANYAETEQICVVYPNHQHSRSDTNSTTPTFVELYSHVQVRGSIPLRWSSPTDIATYRPRVRIGTDPLAQARAMWAHLVEQLEHYADYSVTAQCNNSSFGTATNIDTPKLVFCNLVDKKSDQGRLGRAFHSVLNAVLDVYQNVKAVWNHSTSLDDEATLIQDSSNATDLLANQSQRSLDFGPSNLVAFLTQQTVQHVWFDFHAELKGGKWEKLEALLEELSPTLLQQGYFSAKLLNSKRWTLSQRQSGVVRTNCMDCLDRTNVVQSIIGRYMLFRQLSERHGGAGYKFTKSTHRPNHRNFLLEYSAAFRRDSLRLPWLVGEAAHRSLWADNADVISRLYAGTAALKGDFTRTGQRTKRGAIDDGMNSLQRYYLNNFIDADRQEGIDLMVGQTQFSTQRDLMDERQSSLVYQTTTLKEAIRAMMLGNTGHDDSTSDDRFHVPIKRKGSNTPRRSANDHPVEELYRPYLEFRWLPGDLQNQMRSRVTTLRNLSVFTSNRVHSSDAVRLEAMDRRLANEVPWWVDADSEMDEEIDSQHPADWTLGTNTGHRITALVASLQAPLTTATMAVAMLGLGMEKSGMQRRED